MKQTYYFGFDLENIIHVQEYVENNYSADEYEMLIGHRDTVMKRLDIELRDGEVTLINLINSCDGKGYYGILSRNRHGELELA